MIKVEFEIAIFLYLLISIFSFLIIWLVFLKVKVPTEHSAQRESIWQCFICAYIYVDSKHKKLSICPRCGSYNERKDRKE